MKEYYHATNMENLSSICQKGLIAGVDGLVYLAETPQDALKFVFFRGWKEVLMVQVKLEENKVQESFDHNQEFFGCKAFYVPESIPKRKIGLLTKYNMRDLYEGQKESKAN